MRETSPHGKDNYIPGDHWMICDECGLKYRRSEMLKRWDSLWVCKKDWEPKHPQESVRGKVDKIKVPVSRPDVSLDQSEGYEVTMDGEPAYIDGKWATMSGV